MSTERRKIRMLLQRAITTENESVIDQLSDAIIDIFNQTRPLPGAWGMLGGGTFGQSPADELVKKIRAVAETLEKELRFNDIAAHRDFDKVAKKIIEAETRGQKLETWITWAKRDEKSRAYLFTYARNPNLIWQDWLQAFPAGINTQPEKDGGFYA